MVFFLRSASRSEGDRTGASISRPFNHAGAKRRLIQMPPGPVVAHRRPAYSTSGLRRGALVGRVIDVIVSPRKGTRAKSSGWALRPLHTRLSFRACRIVPRWTPPPFRATAAHSNLLITKRSSGRGPSVPGKVARSEGKARLPVTRKFLKDTGTDKTAAYLASLGFAQRHCWHVSWHFVNLPGHGRFFPGYREIAV